jgi:hypothetical protein
MKQRMHSLDCRVASIASQYGFTRDEAHRTYRYWGERMAKDELQFNDRHCICGVTRRRQSTRPK